MADEAADAEAQRQEALKKKGEEYFQKVLANQAATGKVEPVGRAPRAERPARTRRQKAPVIDEDLHEMETMVERSKLWIAAAAFGLCTTLATVMVKASMHAIPAPSFVLSVHMLPLAGTIYSAASHGVIEGSLIGPRQAKAAAPRAVMYALETLCMFGALAEASVSTTIVWMGISGMAVSSGVDYVLSDRVLPPRSRLYVMGATGFLALLQLLMELRQAGFKATMFLLMYTVVVAAKAGYEVIKEHESVAAMVGEQIASKVRAVALIEAGEDLTPGGRVMFNNLLPAGPLLLLGLVAGEGGQFVDHELSVPHVSTILFSACVGIGAGCAGLTVYERMKPEHLTMVMMGAQLGTVAVDTAVRVRPASAIGVIGAVGCVVLVHVARILKQMDLELEGML